MSKPQPPSPKDYERLGRMLEYAFETGYINKKRLIKINLLKGLAVGVGSVIGATVVVALLLWILSFFNQVPLIGPFVEKTQETVENNNQ